MALALDDLRVTAAVGTGRAVDPPAELGTAPVDAGAVVARLDTLEVQAGVEGEGGALVVRWAVANRGDEPVPVDAVRLRGRLAGAGSGRVRAFRHGWQSWTGSGVATVGDPADPTGGRGPSLLARAMHHADPRPGVENEVRSSLVTVLGAEGVDERLAVGFAGGDGHEGTVVVRRAGDEVEVVAEAYLGGAVLGPGERRVLHPVWVEPGATAPVLLERWADRVGRLHGARTGARQQVGWCSWYQWYHDITEAVLADTLARVGDWPFVVVQVDDGYQSAIGDWLHTAEGFPGGIDQIASAIAGAGRTPGIWLAPFLAAPGSRAAGSARRLARWVDGERPLVGMVNEGWGGEVHVLDTTRPDVLAHLEQVAASLVAAGFRYLKLDFLYAPALPGTYADPARTPAERVRDGLEAVRRGAGDDVFLLGCGSPLGPAVGVVDGLRVGPDVAPHWSPRGGGPVGAANVPATGNAWRNALARSFTHRRLWVNDPDCLLLRDQDTELSADARRAWAYAVAVSGGSVVVSDDLARLGSDAQGLLAEVLALGASTDAVARSGPAPRCDDLLVHDPPTRLTVPGAARLVADPSIPTARIEPA